MDLVDTDYNEGVPPVEANQMYSIHNTDPLEVQVIQIVTELLSTGEDGTFPDGSGDEQNAIRSFNWLAEILEQAEVEFRQSSPTATLHHRVSNLRLKLFSPQ